MEVVIMRHYFAISLFAFAGAVYLRWNSFPYGQFDVIILTGIAFVSFIVLFHLPRLIGTGLSQAVAGLTLFSCSLTIALVENVLPESGFTVAPISVFPLILCLLGILVFGPGFSDCVNQRLCPPPPFFILDKNRVGCVELGGGGTYEECQRFLCELRDKFNAEFSNRLDAGSHPHADKEKGYWDVKILGHEFLVMRERGNGMCIWGPNTKDGLAHFLRIVDHFGATEFVPLGRRATRLLLRKPSY